MSTGEFHYTVLIEWDGNRPPTRWYNRLHRLGLSIRGDKEKSPIQRRQSLEGVVHQEGAIVCKTESQAKALGYLASELGAKAVSITLAETISMEMTPADERVMNNLQAILGKRGRPEIPGNWIINCHDEGHTHPYQGRRPVQCKACGSMLIGLREGEMIRVKLTGKTPFERWFNSRFVTGGWEEPVVVADDADDPEAISTPADYGTVSPENRAYIHTLQTSTLMAQIDKALAHGIITEREALRLMDCGLMSIRRDPARRLTDRINGITAWFKRGGEQNGLLLTVDPGDVDALDVWVTDHTAFRLDVLLHIK